MTRMLALAGSLVIPLAACSGTSLLNAFTTDDGYTVTNDIPYGDDPRQKLDIYQPMQPDAGHTVILFFYGGSWQFGSKDQYRFFAQPLTAKGYTVVIADYRLYPQVYYPDFLNDAAAAFVWTHNHIASYGGNADRLFLAGHSAGAYNAVMLSVNDHFITEAGGRMDWIHGTVGISGPYNFLPLTDPKLIALFKSDHDVSTQPYTYAQQKSAPMLLVTGTDDDLVSPQNTTLMATRLQGLGSDITTHYYAGTGHIGIMLSAARGFRDRTTLLPDIADFIDSH